MTDPVLATHGLTKQFGAVTACDGVNLDLRAGEIHAVIGPNGAGKTTLLQQICGTLRPDAGRIEFLGHDVTATGVQARARAGLARTFQISALAMEDTVLQNATLGALGARGGAFGMLRNALDDNNLRSVAMAALDRVGMAVWQPRAPPNCRTGNGGNWKSRWLLRWPRALSSWTSRWLEWAPKVPIG